MASNWRLGEHVEGSALPGTVANFAVEERSSKNYVPVMVEGLTPANFDEIALVVDSAGNVTTATYKLATVTVGTLTMTYDSNSNLTNVKRT